MDETRRGRPPGFDRAAALQAALHLFWAHGYDATTTRAITSAMDIEAPSLYAAFGSKHELFGQVVELYNRSYRGFMARALTEEPTLRAGLSRLLREAAAAYTQPGKPPGCLFIDAAVNCTCPDVAQMLAGLRNDSVNQLENVIGRAIARGELAADADAHTLATYTSVVMQGMAAQARDGTTRDQLQAAAAQAMQAWPWNSTAPQ